MFYLNVTIVDAGMENLVSMKNIRIVSIQCANTLVFIVINVIVRRTCGHHYYTMMIKDKVVFIAKYFIFHTSFMIFMITKNLLYFVWLNRDFNMNYDANIRCLK